MKSYKIVGTVERERERERATILVNKLGFVLMQKNVYINFKDGLLA